MTERDIIDDLVTANHANMDRPWELWKMRARKNAA